MIQVGTGEGFWSRNIIERQGLYVRVLRMFSVSAMGNLDAVGSSYVFWKIGLFMTPCDGDRITRLLVPSRFVVGTLSPCWRIIPVKITVLFQHGLKFIYF